MSDTILTTDWCKWFTWPENVDGFDGLTFAGYQYRGFVPTPDGVHVVVYTRTTLEES